MNTKKSLVFPILAVLCASLAQAVELTNVPKSTLGQYTGNDYVLGTQNSNTVGRLFKIADFLSLSTRATVGSVPLQQVLIHTNGTYSWNGADYPILSTATAGILDAVQRVPPPRWPDTNALQSLKIKFDSGIFYTTTNITISVSNAPYEVCIEGTGVNGSLLVYAGSATQECLTLGQPNGNNSMVLQLRDMGFGSCVNGTTNIVHLVGYWNQAQPGEGGGIAAGTIERCWFVYWPAITNADRNGIDGLATGTKFNLIGLNIDCNNNNNITVRDCEFAALATGASLAGDHITFENNTIGSWSDPAATNDWPQTSIYACRAGVVCRQPGNGLYIQNGQSWVIRKNTFIGCPVHYASLFYTGVDGGGAGTIGQGPGEWYSAINSFTVYDDCDESGTYLAVTSGNTVRFVNPRRDHNGSNPAPIMPSRLFTAAGDYRLASTVAAPTNLVDITSMIEHTNNGPWGWVGQLTTSTGLDVKSNNVVVAALNSNGMAIASFLLLHNCPSTPPVVSGSDSAIWNSNLVFYGVTASKKLVILDAR